MSLRRPRIASRPADTQDRNSESHRGSRFEKLQGLYKITPSRSDEMAKNDLAPQRMPTLHRLDARTRPRGRQQALGQGMHRSSRAGKGPSNNHNYTRRRPFAYELRGAYGRAFTEVALAEPRS